MPTTYGHHRLLPALGAFRDRYPHVSVEVEISNRNIDFVRDGFDLAIRMGAIRETGLVARKLGDFAVGVFASPAHLGRFGTPTSLEALARHTCIAFVMPSSGRVLPWTFGRSATTFVPQATFRCSEDVLGTVTLARAGVGLIQTYDFVVADDLARGALVEVLRPLRGFSRSFSLIYPASVTRTSAVRSLVEHVLATR
ncbi:hypothetical protein BH11MYX1_BH11MYX1_42730 [soil metagenome]